MKKIIVGMAVVAALLCGCQKMNDLESRMKVAENDISVLKSDVAKLNAAVEKNYSITGMVETAEGYTITLSNGTTINLKNGKDGTSGEAVIKSVTSSDGVVVITLVDGAVYKLPLADDYPLKAVKSLTYIPAYSDGLAVVNYSKREDAEIDLKFMIRPASASAALMKGMESGALKILPLATYPATRALSDEVTELACRSFSIDPDGLLTVKVDASGLSEDFFARKSGASVAVVVTDGVTEISSAFVGLTPVSNGLEYGGVVYRIAKMADGKIWMAENLRYIPEGYVPRSDLNKVDAGVYMPVVLNEDASAAVFGTAADAVNQGYLYQSEVALGLKVGDLQTEEQAAALEGTRGICPEGWHIPTLNDYLGLIGKSVGADTNVDAPYFDGKNGSIMMLNADGFNLAPCGAVSIQDNTKTSGSLMGRMANFDYITSGFTCGSTFAGPATVKDSVITNFQFYGLMPMTNKAAEADYTANGSKLSYRIAASVRCVKD